LRDYNVWEGAGRISVEIVFSGVKSKREGKIKARHGRPFSCSMQNFGAGEEQLLALALVRERCLTSYVGDLCTQLLIYSGPGMDDVEFYSGGLGWNSKDTFVCKCEVQC
jgi:hypothetical protein